MANYKYIVLTDLDGTLLNSNKELSTQTIQYITNLHTRGDILFSFSTGRPWDDCKSIYSQLQLKGFVSCCNSAFIYNPHTQTTVNLFFSKNVCLELLKSPIIINEIVKGYVLTSFTTLEFNEENILKIIKKISTLESEIFCIKLFYDKKCKKINEISNYINSLEPKLKLTLFYDNELVDFEIQSGIVDKEFAVKYFSQYYGVKLKNILTFGDNFNDIEVLSGSSRSYAVSNAHTFVKQSAKFISQHSNDEDSVIKEVDFFLKNIEKKL